MMEVGRLCVKVAGREAGMKCVIVEVVDDKFVMVDGQVKRRKCNIAHLEPLPHEFGLDSGASREDVVSALKTAGVDVSVHRKKWMLNKQPKAIKAATAKKETAKPVKKAAKG